MILYELGHLLRSLIQSQRGRIWHWLFPLRLAKLFEHKGTEYTVNFIPLGGFVRLSGEDDPEVEGGYGSAHPLKRLSILLAGPFTNLLIGVVLGTALFFSIGEPIKDKVIVYQVAPASPAEKAGLLPNDLFLSYDGQVIDSVQKLQTIISERLDVESEMVIQRGEQLITLKLTPRSNPPEGQGAIGVILDNPTQPITIIKAAEQSLVTSFEYIRSLLVLPVRMVQGEVSPEEGRLVGYKGMFDIYREVQNPLWFFTLISMSLGIMNLLPIPALDGGRVMLLLPELLFRKRVSPKFEQVLNMVGFALLILLLIYVNLQDFINPITLP